ncbi:hypothetical protein MTsN3n11_24690 [Qipengyuania sp. MTN3-11]
MTFKLPDNVRPVKDRHGKTRYRFRKAGHKSSYLKGKPGTKEFYASLAKALEVKAEGREIKSQQAVEPRSLDDLFRRMKKSPGWKKKAERTRYAQTRVYERFFDRTDRKGRRYGARPTASVTVGWLETIFGAMDDRPGAADDLRKKMAVLLQYGIALQWITFNAARETTPFGKQSEFHTWSEEEIAAFRQAHPLGTMARLTLELALNTAARRCNVATLTRDDIKAGRIVVAHVKGNNEASVRMLPTTRDALEALPAAPIRHLVTTQFGKPFTVAGLGNRFRKWADEAGLPHCTIHGLRRALARRTADTGSTDAEGQSVTGHKKTDTFVGYRSKAERAALSDKLMDRIEALELSNLHPEGFVQPSESDANAST